MKLTHRFKRLTLWNKIGVVGSLASIVALILALVYRPSPIIIVKDPSDSDIDRLADAVAARLSRGLSSSNAQQHSPDAEGLLPAPELVLALVDTSRSMIRYPVREAVVEFLGALRRHDLVGISAFSESTVEVVPFGDYAQQALRNIMDDLKIDGLFTDFPRAIAVSARALNRTSASSKRLILFTDGLRDPALGQVGSDWPDSGELQNIQLEIVLFRNDFVAEQDAFLRTAKIWHWPFQNER